MSGPSFDDFAALVGSSFTVSMASETDAPQTAILDFCERVATQPGYSSFVLRFTVESQSPSPFGQGTYFFASEAFGPVPIFVVPIGIEASTATYEAVFNLKEEGGS